MKRPKLRLDTLGDSITIHGVWTVARIWTRIVRSGDQPSYTIDMLVPETPSMKPGIIKMTTYTNKAIAQKDAIRFVRKWLEDVGLKQAVQFADQEKPPVSALQPVAPRRRLQLGARDD